MSITLKIPFTKKYGWYSATEARVAESEVGVLYRFNCTAYTSGTVTYRLSI